MWLLSSFVYILFASHSLATEFTEETYYQLPRLFQLDDYNECLSQRDGLYCLGSFHLTATTPSNQLYQLIKEYSQEGYTFNRTLIHRGYCVNKCIPVKKSCSSSNVTSLNAASTNVTALLENCANAWSNTQGMQADLHSLHYCKENHLNRNLGPDVAQIVFLAIVAVIIIMNIIGTACDIKTEDQKKNPRKISLLMAWSIRSNWKLLTTPYDEKEHENLLPLQGIRVIIAVIVCITHTGITYYTVYLYDPRILEHIVKHPFTMVIQNSTSMQQMFVVLSSFLCTYNLLNRTKNKQYSFMLFMRMIIKRIFRISPVYLLIVGYAATWWPCISDGPLWPAMVEAESKVCRNKFWAHAFFVNNLVEPDKFCILPTWYMALDIQMYVIALSVSFTVGRMRRGVIPTLSLLLIASIVMNAALAYVYEWKPLMYFTSVTENIRTMLRDVPSFKYMYMTPWGNLPACLLGILVGHSYKYMLDKPIDKKKYMWLLYPLYMMSLPLLVECILSGGFIQDVEQPIILATYAAIEKSVLQILSIFLYVMLSIMDSSVLKFCSWKGWEVLSRLCLSVMILHWCVALVILGESPQPVSVSAINILTVGAATTTFTFIIALPLTLLVEMPMKSVCDAITA